MTFEDALEWTNKKYGKALKNLAGLLLLCLVGCADAKAKVEFTHVVKVGKTLDANVIPTSFNEMVKTQVRTEQASIVIAGTPSILLGRESFVKMTADGKEKQFCISEAECYKMY